MKNLLFIAVLFFQVQVLAQISSLKMEHGGIKRLSAEAQFNSLSNSTVPTFGPSVYFNITSNDSIGARFLAPVGYGEGTTSAYLVYRRYFGDEEVRLFGELSAGGNHYVQDLYAHTAPSAGTNIGLSYNVNSIFTLGGLAGFEWTNTDLHKHYVVEDENKRFIYARLALFGSLSF